MVINGEMCTQVDKHESARAVKKAELIDTLKRLYPGVVSTTVISTSSYPHLTFCSVASSHRDQKL